MQLQAEVLPKVCLYSGCRDSGLGVNKQSTQLHDDMLFLQVMSLTSFCKSTIAK